MMLCGPVAALVEVVTVPQRHVSTRALVVEADQSDNALLPLERHHGHLMVSLIGLDHYWVAVFSCQIRPKGCINEDVLLAVRTGEAVPPSLGEEDGFGADGVSSIVAVERDGHACRGRVVEFAEDGCSIASNQLFQLLVSVGSSIEVVPWVHQFELAEFRQLLLWKYIRCMDYIHVFSMVKLLSVI